jgi:lipoate-protein ligase A
MLETLNPAPSAGAGPIRCSSWRTLLSPPLTGAENMACDVALMERARATGEAVVRVYSWTAPTLSFGRNQKTAGYDPARLAQAGIDVVRRPTGGRAILHHREITYSVTAPAEPGEPIAAAYEWINELLLAALLALGVDAEIARRARRAGRAPPPDANPCFATAAPGEITADGRKLVGSAQYREGGAMLQHGSILVEDDQSALAALAGTARQEPPATLAQALGRAPHPRELYDALCNVMTAAGVDAEPLSASELADATARHAAAFLDSQWTWRR